ncbi:MAG: pseudaminic acid cytidylyltransferase, partial [Desulfobulbaceae bacterium]|nr:pseudaminic acid cytidylyltransferase [Desulfobulbaceae bacterium]
MNKKQNLAIILARGGSTRIPKKNIVGFLGEPLIARMIRACQEAQIFDRILVATDDDDIIKVAGDYGVEVPFKREFFN